MRNNSFHNRGVANEDRDTIETLPINPLTLGDTIVERGI